MSVYRSLDDFTASFMDSFILGMKVLITRDLNEEVLLGFSCSCLSQLVTRTTDTSMTNGCGAYNKSENVAMLAKVTPKKKNLLIGEEVDTEIKSEPCTILTSNAMFLFL